VSDKFNVTLKLEFPTIFLSPTLQDNIYFYPRMLPHLDVTFTMVILKT